MKDLKQRMIEFKEATYNLLEEWNKLDCPSKEVDISYKYPFSKDFDELNRDINIWVETHTKAS